MFIRSTSWYQPYIRRLKALTPFYGHVQKLKEEIDLLTNYSSDTIYRLRYRDMSYDYISQAIVRLLGYTAEEMQHINFRSLILESKVINGGFEAVESFNLWENKRKSGSIGRWQADYLMRTKDGRQIWVNDISYPWYNYSGKLVGSIGSLRDITAHVEAERRSNERVNQLTHTDQTTGLANRVCFFEHIHKELNHIQHNNEHFSILLIDIDGLKQINDMYDFKVGDKILREVSHIIRSCLRKEDVAARTSGGEFGVFLPNTPEEGAYWVGEHVCLQIAKHPFLEGELSIPLHCTVSIGVASTQGNRLISAAALYKNADTRLYIAKHTGRNQVSVDEIMHIH